MEPRAQAKVLREQIQKLVHSTVVLNEQVIRLGHEAIHHEVQALLAGKKHTSALGTLTQIQGVLFLIDGWLTLTDEELSHHLNEIHGLLPGVATYAHLVKGVTEILGGTIVAGSTFAYAIAKTNGKTAYAAQALGLARGTALTLANVVAGVEIIWGIATLLDPHASNEKKDQALLATGMGVGWFVGGGPGSAAVLAVYLKLKLAAHLYWSANLNIVGGWMSIAFENIQERGKAIAESSDELYRCGEILSKEKDPEQVAALGKVEENLVRGLGRSIDSFINDCQPRGYAAGVARYPGAYKILREVFQPIMGLKGRSDQDGVVAAAALVIEKIVWCLSNASELVSLAARKKTVAGSKLNEKPGDDGAGGEH
jgi:hypothetical protein